MNNDYSVSMKYKNSVTGLKKLEEYEKRLNSLKKMIQNMPSSVVISGIDTETKEANEDTKELSKNIGKTHKKHSSFKKSLKSTQKLLKKAFGVGIFLAFAKGLSKATNSLQDNIAKSSEYVENLNLMQVAFKETGEANDRFNESFVNGLADSFGLDESTMTRQLGFYRQIGNALEIDSKYADMLSRNLLKMQLDISSLYNLSFERSGEVIQASIAGQTKPVRGATGADITQASLQKTLDDLGIDRAISDLSRGEKVLTIYLSLVDQLSESQGDLAKTINSVANQEKIFTEQTQRLSRMVGNVFSVSVGRALPYINAFLMVINELVEKFAILVGFELPTYEQSGGGYDLGDYLDDTADSADKLSKSLRGLRSFDKLNVITTPKDKGSGSLSGGVDKRLLNALKDYNLQLESMENKATKIRDTMMEWLGFTKEVDEATGEITWKYDTLGKSAKQIAEEIGTNLGKNLSIATKNIEWEEIGSNIANGINIALRFTNSFVDNYEWFELGESFAKGLNKTIEELDWNDVGKAFTNKFKIIISTSSGFLQEFDYGEFGKSVAEFINAGLENIPIEDLTDGINAFTKGFFKALGNLFINLDWGAIVKDVFKIIGGLEPQSYILLLLPLWKKIFSSSINQTLPTSMKKGFNLGLSEIELIAASTAITVGVVYKISKDIKQLKKEAYEAGTEEGRAHVKGYTQHLEENLANGIMPTMEELNTLFSTSSVNIYNASESLKKVFDGNIIERHTKDWKDYRNILYQTGLEYGKNLEFLEKYVSTQELSADEQQKIYNYIHDEYDVLEENLDLLFKGSDQYEEIKNQLDESEKIIKNMSENYLKIPDTQEKLNNIFSKSKYTLAELNSGFSGLNGKSDKYKNTLYKAGIEYGNNLSFLKEILSTQELSTDEQEKIYDYACDYRDTLSQNLDTLQEGTPEYDKIKGLIKESDDLIKQMGQDYQVLPQEQRNLNKEIENAQTSGETTFGKLIKGFGKVIGSASTGLGELTGKDYFFNFASKTDKLTTGVNTAMDKISGVFRSIFDKEYRIKMNGDSSELERNTTSTLRKIADKMGSTFSIFNSLSGKTGISAIGSAINTWSNSIKNVLKFEDGGLPPVGQLFVANEKGPELVGHIGGQSFVANQNQMMNLLDSKIGSSKQPINLTVINKVDDEEISRKTFTNIQDMFSANGKPIEIG